MTLAMADSIEVGNLPPGYDAYLGYADGNWPTARALAQKFPQARRVILTVSGNTVLGAHGCDIENGDLGPTSGVHWAVMKLAPPTMAGFRPVLYASVSAMGGVLQALHSAGINWSQVRLLSAHYGQGPHICGPASCGEIPLEMDGTQWTAQFKGLNGSDIDMSLLADDFFGSPPALTRTERLVQELGTVRQGMTGAATRTVQGLCVARGQDIEIDGVFGTATRFAVQNLQLSAKITEDGVVGPLTWPVLLGVAG